MDVSSFFWLWELVEIENPPKEVVTCCQLEWKHVSHWLHFFTARSSQKCKRSSVPKVTLGLPHHPAARKVPSPCIRLVNINFKQANIDKDFPKKTTSLCVSARPSPSVSRGTAPIKVGLMFNVVAKKGEAGIEGKVACQNTCGTLWHPADRRTTWPVCLTASGWKNI